MTVTYVRKSQTAKNDTLNLRISQKDKYALELLAQKMGIPLSAVIMEAVKPLMDEHLTIELTINRKSKKALLPELVWDPLVPDKLIKLATYAPEMLTDQQAVIWKVIREEISYWDDEDNPKSQVIRDNWDTIQDKASHLYEEHSK